MKKQLLLLLTFSMSLAAIGQVSSTDGTFSAAGTTNLGLRTNTTTRLTILGSGTSAGFVGVNTAAPADWFHVNGNIRTSQVNLYGGILNSIAPIGSSSIPNLSFRTNNTPRMTIVGSGSTIGNVGIGTTTPSQLLSVVAPNPVVNIQTPTGSDPNVRMLRFARSDDTALASLELYGGSGEFRINTANSYFPTFVVAGTEVMRITGNVGIGTTAPAYKLDVNGAINATSLFVNGQPVSGGSSSWVSDGANTYIPSGNIGIGTTTPDGFQVNLPIASEAAQAFSNVRIGTINGFPRIILDNAGGTPVSMDNVAGKFRIFHPGIERLVIDPTGKVGIGETAPQAKLHISVAAGEAGLYFGGNDSWINYTDGNNYLRNNTVFADTNADHKVGIGTPTPAHKLDVNGVIGINGKPVINTAASAGDDIYINSRVIRNESTTNLDGMYVNYNSSGSTEAHLRLYANGAAERMRIDATTGYVGIGTPTPAYNLDVAGTINATSILVGGQPISGGSSSWANIGSDINFLTGNVGIGKAPATGNKLDVAGAINSSSFFLNGNSAGQGDPTFTTRSTGTKLVLNPSLAAAAADYAFGTSANTLWSSVNTTSSSFKWFGGRTLAATLSGGGNLTLVGVAKANNLVPSSVNLTTAGATTTLSASSAYYQNSTVAQTIKLPLATTLTNGHQFFIKNSSTQPVTVQTSAGTALQVMAANATLELTCINTAGGTGTASWQWVYNTNTAGGSGGASQWTTTGSDIAFNSGRVGIGITPAMKLHLATGSALDGIAMNHSNGAWANFYSPSMTGGAFNGITQPGDAGLIFGTNSGVNTVSNGFVIAPHRSTISGLRINNNGDVGIGTASPVSELQVNSGPLKISLGRVPGQYSQALGWSNQFIGLNLARNSAGWIAHTDGVNNGGSMLLGDIFGNLKVVNVPSSGASDQVLNESQINSNTKFVVNSNGNVGISGSLSVSTDIATNGNIEVGRGDNLDTKLRFHNHNQAWYSMGIDMSDAGKFKINSGGNIGDVAHFTMDGNGNVGIGNSNPGSLLDVRYKDAATNIYRASDSNGQYRWRLDQNFNMFLSSSAGTDIVKVGQDGSWFNAGNVGIGTTSANARLQVESGSDASNALRLQSGGFSMNGTAPFSIDANGVYSGRFVVLGNGNVGIGTANPTQKLTVKGTVYSTEVKVDLSAGAPDYVFEKEYNLPTLDSIKAYIDKNKHLPEVPSAKEMEKNGVNLGEMNMLLLKKIEELTLHLIEMKNENEALKTRVEKIENRK